MNYLIMKLFFITWLCNNYVIINNLQDKRQDMPVKT